MDFVYLVKQAVLENNITLRVEAEGKLMELRANSPEIFLNLASEELKNENNPTNLRQACGTLLKRSLTMPTQVLFNFI